MVAFTEGWNGKQSQDANPGQLSWDADVVTMLRAILTHPGKFLGQVNLSPIGNTAKAGIKYSFSKTGSRVCKRSQCREQDRMEPGDCRSNTAQHGLLTVVLGRLSRSTMSSTGKAARSSSTVTTFRKPNLEQCKGSKARQF